jgi:DNA-directed RNA polymerase II subunit RPB7
MFFVVLRSDTLQLEPKYFSKDIGSRVLSQLRKKVEGQLTGRYGYTVAVVKIQSTSKGRLHMDSGFAHFDVQYFAVVMRPFLNEVIQATVTQVAEAGIWARAGPLQIYVSADHNMPEDLKFDATRDGEYAYVSETDEIRLVKGSPIRVKIIAMKSDINQIKLLGSLNRDYLLV